MCFVVVIGYINTRQEEGRLTILSAAEFQSLKLSLMAEVIVQSQALVSFIEKR